MLTVDGQVFRIEVPVESQNNIDVASFNQVAQVLDKILQKTESMGSKLDKALNTQAFSKVGQQATGASQKIDKFSQSMEKTNSQLERMTKDRHEIALELKDRALVALKNTYNTAKSLTSKAFYMTVRLKDFITAPLRNLWNTVINPITMAASALGLGFGVTDIVSTFNDFESGMSNVKALTQATNEDFSKLRQQALDLGATTKFTAAQAAEGMQYLGMAGWETSEILAAMPGLLSLAAAGNTDLGTSADIVSDVMTAMGMAADQATMTADVFSLATAKSNTTIEQLGEAMKYAAPIAHNYGMNLQEATGVLGLMANASIKGSMAGTAMRSALLRMADPPAEAAEQMKKLNLQFTKSDGSMKDIVTIVRDCETAFGKLSQSEKLASAQMIFGTEAASGWLGVIDQGADVLETFIRQLDDSSGAAQEMADIQLDNLAGDITLLQSAMDGMKVALADKLSPYAREFIQSITASIPNATSSLTGFIDTAIAKAGEMKTAISQMTSSEEWADADFAGKLGIAWDTLIVDPFNKWWGAGGKAQVTGIATQVGDAMGGTLSGIITGAFALLGGEDVTGEGLNLSPMAAAGFDAGAAFTTAFADAFDANEVVSKIPGAIASVFDDAAKLLPGGEEATGTSWLSAILVGAGASQALEFFGSVGINVQTIADGLALCKSGIDLLATLPGPVQAAGAIVAGVAVGVAAYNAALEQYETNLLSIGDRVNEAVSAYETAGERLSSVQELLAEREELTMQLDIASNYSPEQIAQAKSDLETLDQRASNINAALQNLAAGYDLGNIRNAETIMQEIAGIDGAIQALEGKRTSIQSDIAMGKITKAEGEDMLAEIESQLTNLNTQRNNLTESFEVGGLTYETFLADYKSLTEELSALNEERAALTQIIEFSGLSEEDKTAIINRIGEIDAALMGLSNGLISQYDLETGAIERKLEALEKQAEMQREIERLQMQATIAEAEKNVPKVTKVIDKQTGIRDDALTKGSALSDYATVIAGFRNEAAMLEAEYANAKATMSKSEFSAFQDDWGDRSWDLYNRFWATSSTAADLGLKMEWQAPENIRKGKASGELSEMLTKIATEQGKLGTTAAEAQTKIDEGNQTLIDLYSAKKRDVELALLEGMTFEAAAADYANMTAEQRASFAQAVEKLREVNETSPYVDPMNQIDPTALWGMAYKSTSSALAASSNHAATIPDYSAYHDDTIAYLEALQRIDEYHQAVASGDTSAMRAAAEALVNNSHADLGDGELMLNTNHIDESGQIVAETLAMYEENVKKSFANAGNYIEGFTQDQKANIEKMKADLVAGGQQYELLMQQAEAAARAETDLTAMRETASTMVSGGTWDAESAQAMMEYYEGLQSMYGEAGIELPELDITQLTDAATAVAEIQTALETATAAKESIETEASNLAQNMAALFETVSSLTAFEQLGATASAAAAALNAQAVQGAADFKGYQSAAQSVTNEINAWPKYVKTVHEIVTIERTQRSSSGGLKYNANGGIYDGAFLSWVAEDGPEAIIPLGSKRRGRGLDLWYQAGQALGVPGLADGGIFSYGGDMDVGSYYDDYDDIPVSIPSPGGSGGAVDVKAPITLTVTVQGSDDPMAVVKAIRENKNDIADLLAGTISEAVGEIIENR